MKKSKYIKVYAVFNERGNILLESEKLPIFWNKQTAKDFVDNIGEGQVYPMNLYYEIDTDPLKAELLADKQK
jgi:hypothetical protein